MRRLAESRYGVVLLIAGIVALTLLLLPSPFHLRIAALVFIFALAVTGLNLLMTRANSRRSDSRHAGGVAARGPHHRPRGAERQRGAGDRGPRLCAGNRPHRPRRKRRRARARPAGAGDVSRGVSADAHPTQGSHIFRFSPFRLKTSP